MNISRYKGYTRIRLLHKVLVGGVRKTLLVEHIGSARSDPELALLRIKAERRMEELHPQLSLLAELEAQATAQATDTSRLVISGSFAQGLWQIVGGIYDQLGLPNELLKQLVLARIALPKSKLMTARFLTDNLNYSVSVSMIYKYMDSLNKEQLMVRLLDYTQKRAVTGTGQTISVVFYDVTTLYFETDEDDPDTLEPHTNLDTGEITDEIVAGLRKKGYSKDHRYDLPQVVVGLTVDSHGFPLDFQVYEGNTYEGHTLLAGIRTIQAKLRLSTSNLTVVADAGMLSAANLEELESVGYTYIVGARIRSSSAATAEQITGWDYTKQGTFDKTLDGRRMVVTYSQKRAERSQKNRARLVSKLQAKLRRGQVVKKSKYVILDTGNNNRKLSGRIDQAKLDADQCFDGLKGYVTNSSLSAAEVVNHYSNLWHVEKSFRMSKSDLRARPTFHYKRERVIAHLVICVCSLAVLKEFEERLNAAIPGVGLSLALEQLLAIRCYQLRLPDQQQITVNSELTEVQRKMLLL